MRPGGSASARAGAGGGGEYRRRAGRRRAWEGGKDGVPAHVCAGSQPAQVGPAPSPAWSPPPTPDPVPPEAATPRSSRPVSPALPPPLPAPQANRFLCSREKRGSFQSCSELDAFPRASWSVSKQPGLGWEPHAGCPPTPTPILHSGSHPGQKLRSGLSAGGSLGYPRPSHLSPRSGAVPPGPLPP